jgi:uncharacterized protein YjbJ (UPF0337 family)
MHWDQISGKWPQHKSKIKQQWGKLTNDDLERINGNRDALLARLQERYGWSKEQAEQELADYFVGRWSISQ